MEADKQFRIRRASRPELFHYQAGDTIRLAPVGTALVLFARKGNPQLAAIRQALARQDAAALDLLIADLAAYFREPNVLGLATPREAAALLAKEPAYGELRFESKVLIPILSAPAENPLGMVVLPYTGGPLHVESFHFEEFVREAGEPGLEVVVVAREPELSPLERGILESAAASETGMLLGPTTNAFFWALVARVVVVTVLGTLCYAGNHALSEVGIKDVGDAANDSTACAMELLKLRERIILRYS